MEPKTLSIDALAAKLVADSQQRHREGYIKEDEEFDSLSCGVLT